MGETIGRGRKPNWELWELQEQPFFPSVCRIAGSHHPLSEPQLATWQPHATWCLFDLSPAAQLELITKLKLLSYYHLVPNFNLTFLNSSSHEPVGLSRLRTRYQVAPALLPFTSIITQVPVRVVTFLLLSSTQP